MLKLSALDNVLRYAAVDPEPGTLLLFPGWLPHAVTRLDAPDRPPDAFQPRVALAFNFVEAE